MKLATTSRSSTQESKLERREAVQSNGDGIVERREENMRLRRREREGKNEMKENTEDEEEINKMERDERRSAIQEAVEFSNIINPS